MARRARLGCGVALLVLLSGPALAASSKTNGVSVSGSAANACTLGTPTLVASSDAVLNSATSGAASVTISNFVDPGDATYIDGISISLNFAAMCNYASHFNSQTQSGALKNTTPVVAGSGTFITSVNYQALLQWASQNSTLNTNGTALKKGTQKNVNGAFTGTAALSITLLDPGSTRPLVSGSFTDQLVIQIGAAL